jgi:hypothetical protein
MEGLAGPTLAMAVSGALAFALFAAIGVLAVKNLTLALEGKMEFQGDSLTKRSRLAGFAWFALWAVGVALAWSFFIDWYWFGDLTLALANLWLRLEIILHVLAEMSSD